VIVIEHWMLVPSRVDTEWYYLNKNALKIISQIKLIYYVIVNPPRAYVGITGELITGLETVICDTTPSAGRHGPSIAIS
ncbi:hypothetical protein K1T71_012330, partial [Dendrolimus kikuchii]